MGREDAWVNPTAERRERKARDVAAERRKRSIIDFQEKHPLARIYKDIIFIDYARDEKNWRQFALWGNDLVTAFANLSQTEKDWLTTGGKDALLPNPPEPLGALSAWEWLVYLGSLRAAESRWVRLREAVRDRIVGLWGAEFLPTVLRPVSRWDYEEPPF